MEGLTLSGIRHAGGEETPRFEATLRWRGRPVALVSNGGTGGACRVWWRARAGGPATDPDTIEAIHDEAIRLARADDPHLFEEEDGETALDYVLIREVEIARLMASLDRAAKRSVLYRLPEMDPGTYYAVAGDPSEAALAACEARHPGAIILNRLPSRDRARLLAGYCP